MIKVILDTNFLLYCAKEKLDYYEAIDNLLKEGFELIVPDKVIEELKRVSVKKKERNSLFKRRINSKFKKTTGLDKLACELAIKLLDHYKVKIIKTQENNVDLAIINIFEKYENSIVATLDKEMRKKLKRVIMISKGKKVILSR
jgi:rRNA-processing protein FCF1